VLLVCASCIAVLIPNYMTLAVATGRDPATDETIYEIVTTSHQPNSTAVDAALSTVNFWIHDDPRPTQPLVSPRSLNRVPALWECRLCRVAGNTV